MFQDKIFMLEGIDKAAELITIAPNERVNLDHVVATVALRYPEVWHPELGDGPILIDLHKHLKQFVSHLFEADLSYCLLAEYGNVISDRGDDIKVIIGECLSLSWLKESVCFFHKSRGQSITRIKVIDDNYYVDDESCSDERILDILTRLAVSRPAG